MSAARGAPITVADVRARFAALSKPFDDGVVELAIEDVHPFFDRARWGGFYKRAACGLVMHFLIMARAAERTGGRPVLTATSKKAGEVQASYAVQAALVGDDAAEQHRDAAADRLAVVLVPVVHAARHGHDAQRDEQAGMRAEALLSRRAVHSSVVPARARDVTSSRRRASVGYKEDVAPFSC